MHYKNNFVVLAVMEIKPTLKKTLEEEENFMPH